MRAGPADIRKRIVLVGGGHAHVGVLKSFGMRPEPTVELVLVAKELDAPYSGMLPGFVAGHYTLDECHIDLVRLARFAGATLIHGEAVGLDRDARRLEIAGRPAIAFDLLSLDTGITPDIDDIDGAAEHGLAVKPVSQFAPRWQALEDRALAPGGPRRIAVIGTGAAGFELALAIHQRLRSAAPAHGLDPSVFEVALIGSGTLLPTHPARARRAAERALAEAGIKLVTGEAVVGVEADAVQLASGRRLAADAALLTTKAAPPGWFRSTGLPLDDRGFVAVRPSLQVLDDDDIFAVGDCATVIDHPRDKAGVFAVRQAAPLARNLRLRVAGGTAKPFVPQRQFLTLLSCGGRTAIAARGGISASGAWAWWLKDRIDRSFMRKFQELPEMAGSAGEAMLCAGCGAKLGPAGLAGALDRLAPPPGDLAVRDLSPRDDAALLDLGPGPLRLETVDHFPAIWPDPYRLGEIVAAHALGDIIAKGGRADHALAAVTLVAGKADRLAEDDLFQLLSGIRAVLDREGVALVGGHTTRGETLAAGLFVSGTVARDSLLAKGGLRAGDALVLTRPLGTGVLFAGWMRGLARAREIAGVLEQMRRPETAAAAVVRDHGAAGVTDVTGFGLAGHLLEMLEAAGLTAELSLARCPRYDGVDRLIAAGVRSSLLPENLACAARVSLDDGLGEAALALLLDPQTSGGLLAGIPAAGLDACLDGLAAVGARAAVIGHVLAPQPGGGPAGPLIRVRRDLPAPGPSRSCGEVASVIPITS